MNRQLFVQFCSKHLKNKEVVDYEQFEEMVQDTDYCGTLLMTFIYYFLKFNGYKVLIKNSNTEKYIDINECTTNNFELYTTYNYFLKDKTEPTKNDLNVKIILTDTVIDTKLKYKTSLYSHLPYRHISHVFGKTSLVFNLPPISKDFIEHMIKNTN